MSLYLMKSEAVRAYLTRQDLEEAVDDSPLLAA